MPNVFRSARPALLVLPLLLATQSLLASVQDEIDRLAPGRWLELTANAAGTLHDTKLQRVFPPRDGHPGWGLHGPTAVMRAWNGAAYDSHRNWLIVTGGGHNNYAGNEVYAFDLTILEWRRLTDPSPLTGDPKAPTTTDGTPISRHTYDGFEYLPDLDRVFMFGGATWPSGGATDRAAWLFAPDTGQWREGAKAPYASHVASAVDPATGTVFVRLPRRLMEYDPRVDRWQIHIDRDYRPGSGSAVIDPGTSRFVLITKKALHYVDLKDLRARQNPRNVRPQKRKLTWIGVRTKGEAPPNGNEIGLEYDPVRRTLVGWDGGPEVWTLNTRTWIWARIPNANGPAPEKYAKGSDGKPTFKTRGVFGRWRYVPDRDVFIGVNSTGDNVWIYRMPDRTP